MAQVPDFNASAPMMSSPMMAPPVAAVPPSPMTSGRTKSGGGKGLVIGLGAVGGILLIAIGVLAARSMSANKDAPITPLGVDVAGAGAGTTLGTGSVQTLQPLDSAAPEPPVAAPTAATAGSVAPIQTSKTGTPPAAGTGTGKATPPPSAANACDACIAAANAGNISAAASDLSRCTDAAKKALCTSAARNNAPQAVKSAALNGNCAQAKAILAAAQSIGAASGKLGSSLAGSSCK
jgi:hypothetical protein